MIILCNYEQKEKQDLCFNIRFTDAIHVGVVS